MQYLLSSEFRIGLKHGGELGRGKRKERRVLCVKRPLHIVLKSSYSLLIRHRALVQRLLRSCALRYGVRVYEVSVNSNHIHLLVRGKTRLGIQSFLRVFSGQVAQFIMRAFKGHRLTQAFWLCPAFTRVLAWGRAFHVVRQYVLRNQLEASGLIAYLRPSRT